MKKIKLRKRLPEKKREVLLQRLLKGDVVARNKIAEDLLHLAFKVADNFNKEKDDYKDLVIITVFETLESLRIGERKLDKENYNDLSSLMHLILLIALREEERLLHSSKIGENYSHLCHNEGYYNILQEDFINSFKYPYNETARLMIEGYTDEEIMTLLNMSNAKLSIIKLQIQNKAEELKK